METKVMGDAASELAADGLSSLLSYTTQNRLPRGDTVGSGLDPPTSVINQEKPLTDLMLGYLMGYFLH